MKKLLAEKVVKTWNKLPSEVITAPSLLVFKKELGDALIHWV